MMTYQEAVDYIEETPKFTKKNSLDHTRAFLKRLGSPEDSMKNQRKGLRMLFPGLHPPCGGQKHGSFYFPPSGRHQ